MGAAGASASATVAEAVGGRAIGAAAGGAVGAAIAIVLTAVQIKMMSDNNARETQLKEDQEEMDNENKRIKKEYELFIK